MDEINLTSQIPQPINNLFIQNIPIELIELSEEVLSQVQEVWSGPNVGNIPPVNPTLPDLCCFCWSPPEPPISEAPYRPNGSAL
jgi:hypothetical protein